MLKLKLAVMWLQIRALQINADGQVKCLAIVSDRERYAAMKISNETTLAEITRLKAEYRRIKRGHGIRAACLGVA